MPLQKQPFALQFAGGIETKQDSKQVPTTQLLNLENATFIKATTLAKRNGYRALGRLIDGQAKRWTTATGLAARDSELIAFADNRAYSYRPSADNWSDTGPVASVPVSLAAVARSGTQQANADAATNQNVTVVAYEDATKGGVWCVVLEAGTQRELLAATQLNASGQRPRCVAVGTVLHVYYAVPSGSQIWVAVVNPRAATVTPTPNLLVVDLKGSNPVYDVCPTSGYRSDDPAIIVWADGSLGGFRIGYVHISGALGSALYGLPGVITFSAAAYQLAAASPLTLDVWLDASATAPDVIVAWQNTSNQIAWSWQDAATFVESSKGNSSATGTWLRGACKQYGTRGASTAWIAFEQSGSTADVNSVLVLQVTAGAAGGTTRRIKGHGLASKLWLDSGQVFGALVHPVFYFPYVAVLNLSATTSAGTPAVGSAGYSAPVARLLPGLSSGLPTRTHLPSVTISGRQYTIPLGFRIQLSSENADQFGETGIQLATLDFASQAAWQSAQLGRGLYLAGGCPLHYDSARWAEAGFHCAPDTATGAITTVTAGGGSMTSSGKYLYLYCYEEIDALGELHQGPITGGTLVTMGGADTQVTHTIPTLRLTSRRQVRIAVYRSDFNATGTIDQINFHRVTSTDPTAVGANGYLANDPTVDSVSFVDRMSDATADTKETLYTNGGILSNDPSPMAGNAITGGKSRLFWTDGSDPNLVRFSQELRDDTALEAPQPLSQRCDPYGGSVVGFGIMDGGVFAFKDTAIYVTDGPGPDADGGKTSTNAFTPFALLTSDVGCKSAGSICQTPIGITFQSSKGIKLLGRDRQIQDIGGPVYAFNSQTIVRATLLPDRHQVVFLTDSGTTLLWDYERNQWSKFTNHEGLDAVVVDGSYYYMRTDGRVFVETPGVYQDDNSHIQLKIETAWIKMAGYLQGWQKVLYAAVIGTYKSSHSLRVRYRLDYDDGYTAIPDINVDSNYSPANYGDGNFGDGAYGGAITATTRYQQQVHINRRCQAVAFEFSDVEDTDTFGAAFELSELLITGGVLTTKFPMGAARSS